jgi:hypothetical protein
VLKKESYATWRKAHPWVGRSLAAVLVGLVALVAVLAWTAGLANKYGTLVTLQSPETVFATASKTTPGGAAVTFYNVSAVAVGVSRMSVSSSSRRIGASVTHQDCVGRRVKAGSSCTVAVQFERAPTRFGVIFITLRSTGGVARAQVTVVRLDSFESALIGVRGLRLWPLVAGGGGETAGVGQAGPAQVAPGVSILAGTGAEFPGLVGARVVVPFQMVDSVGLTVGAWVRTTSSGQDMEVFSDRGVSGLGQSVTLSVGGSIVIKQPGVVAFGVDGPGHYVGVQSTATVNNGQWHLIVGVWSGVEGRAVAPSQFAIFVDGRHATVQPVVFGGTQAPISGNGEAQVGGILGGWSPYEGLLRDVFVVGRAVGVSSFNVG